MIARDYSGPVILNPRDKVARDQEIAARNREIRARNTAARAAYKTMVARSHGRNVPTPTACSVCGTPITDPRSIERGIGPRCYAHRDQAQQKASE